MKNFFKIFQQWIARSHLWRSFLLALCAIFIVLATHANAAPTVLLQYRDLRLNIPLAELKAFAENGTLSTELQTFFQTAQQEPTTIQTYLTSPIEFGRTSLIPSDFGLLVINKAIGEPLRRENNLNALRTAIKDAVKKDDSFSAMELIENYPESSVRLSLDELIPVYRDVNLLLTRITPVLNIAEQLLPELVCGCNPVTLPEFNSPPSSSIIDPNGELKPLKSSSHQAIAFTEASSLMKSLLTDDAIASTEATNSKNSLLLSQTDSSSTPLPNKDLVVSFGPIQSSISLAELTTFVETGYLPPAWRFYLSLAKANPDELRSALKQEVQVDARFLYKTLNSLLGEYVLYQVGQIVHTRSKTANIQVLRAAMVQSALDDNRISFLELLKHYPNQQMFFNGLKLARLGGQISRLEAAGEETDTVVSLEDWLVEVQVSLAKELCTCDGEPANPTPINALQISPDRISQFLPPNWTPVPSHREDRGNIKVVWLQGTPYEMGYQHGQLLHDEIASLGRDTLMALGFAGRGLGLGNLAEHRSYRYASEECRGMADATQDIGMTFDACMVLAYGDVYQDVFGYTLPKELFWEGCSQFVAVNQASRDGYLYHGSTVDNSTPIQYVINHSVVFVRQPYDGLPHVFVAYPGVVWPNSGLNVASISLGLDTALAASADELSFTGASNVQLMAQILQGATSFDEAVAYMESQPRVRPNIIMATDGKSKQAGVFEFTGKNFAVRSLQENGVLYTTNHFVLEEMFDKQAPPRDSSLSRYERYEQLLEPNGRDSYYGQVDPAIGTKILRDRVNPKTLKPSPLDVFDDNASPGGNGALRQAIYDPQRLLFWVGAGQPPVPENPFVCFSLGELLAFPNATPCPTPKID